jgi:hypothetical protein
MKDLFSEINQDLKNDAFSYPENAILLINDYFTYYENDKPFHIYGFIYWNLTENDKILLPNSFSINKINSSDFIKDLNMSNILLYCHGKLPFDKCLQLTEKNIISYYHGEEINYDKDDLDYLQFTIKSIYNPININYKHFLNTRPIIDVFKL